MHSQVIHWTQHKVWQLYRPCRVAFIHVQVLLKHPKFGASSVQAMTIVLWLQ